jgi:hypothetical protein
MLRDKIPSNCCQVGEYFQIGQYGSITECHQYAEAQCRVDGKYNHTSNYALE